MTQRLILTRRALGLSAAAALLLPRPARAEFLKIEWDDLIPPGVPYAEIIEDGIIDEVNDTWRPVFDENATRFNTELDGQAVTIPGYIIPLDIGTDGVTSFILVPYVGACIHVPPPPPNQLIFVTTESPWPSQDLWEAVWVSGRLSAQPHSTEIAEIGYQISAEVIELFEI